MLQEGWAWFLEKSMLSSLPLASTSRSRITRFEGSAYPAHDDRYYEKLIYKGVRYVPYAVAEVRWNPSTAPENFDNQCFRILAKYIGVFGDPNNVARRSMAMTAPVCHHFQHRRNNMHYTFVHCSSIPLRGKHNTLLTPRASMAGPLWQRCGVAARRRKNGHDRPGPVLRCVTEA